MTAESDCALTSNSVIVSITESDRSRATRDSSSLDLGYDRPIRPWRSVLVVNTASGRRPDVNATSRSASSSNGRHVAYQDAVGHGERDQAVPPGHAPGHHPDGQRAGDISASATKDMPLTAARVS